MENFAFDSQYVETIILTWGPRLISALLVFILGWWLSRRISSVVLGLLVKAQMDPTLASFVRTLTHAVLVILTVIITLTQLGIQTTSLIAVVGAAGLAVGLALKDSLSNIAAGILLTAFRPFRIGDFIDCAGTAGTVEHIGLLYTELKTSNNQHVVMPNSNLLQNTLTNFSTKTERRIDMTVGVGYSSNLAHVRKVLERILAEESRILPAPAPVIGVAALADNSVNFVVRPWVKSSDYWDVYFALNERIKTLFDEENIEIPFPQRTIHIEGGFTGPAAAFASSDKVETQA
ncbi:mechanosensitive ion channel [Pokkaliibacter sp. MBI-7]|uniref:Small-conductance mechanosensitive channel n=1 Tax=Proteobacteria bacterium 228 TaxID=2083153 RepID=A0A2S5KUP6_9PROT|nr:MULTISPECIES: mechanosensitive ion channel domain-containing protein [Pokkaliibacter]MDH2436108.1 mechanosensitive ion channel [Pokkaliibacter sp. MBI-7]PPC78584.1 mechanosensitive ion channel protein MscS [Pokkaliibacter plantistimulans]